MLSKRFEKNHVPAKEADHRTGERKSCGQEGQDRGVFSGIQDGGEEGTLLVVGGGKVSREEEHV